VNLEDLDKQKRRIRTLSPGWEKDHSVVLNTSWETVSHLSRGEKRGSTKEGDRRGSSAVEWRSISSSSLWQQVRSHKVETEKEAPSDVPARMRLPRMEEEGLAVQDEARAKKILRAGRRKSISSQRLT